MEPQDSIEFDDHIQKLKEAMARAPKRSSDNPMDAKKDIIRKQLATLTGQQSSLYKTNQDVSLGLILEGKTSPFTQVENPYQTGVRVVGNIITSPIRAVLGVTDMVDRFANGTPAERDAMQGEVAVSAMGAEGLGTTIGMSRLGMKGSLAASKDGLMLSGGGGDKPPHEYWVQMEQELSTRLNNVNDKLARRDLSKQEITDLTNQKQEINNNLLAVIRVRNATAKKPPPTEPSKPKLRGKKTLLEDTGTPGDGGKVEGPIIRPESTNKVKVDRTGETINVWTNPSRQAIKDMQEQGIKTFRFYMKPNGDIDVWPAFDAIHEDVSPGITKSNLVQGNVTYDPQTGRALYDVLNKNKHGMVENLKLTESQLRKKADTLNKPRDVTFEEEMARGSVVDSPPDVPNAISNVIEGPFNKPRTANDNVKIGEDGLIELSPEDKLLRDAWDDRLKSIKDDLNITRKQIEQIKKDENPSLKDIRSLQTKEKSLKQAEDDFEYNLWKQDQERNPDFLKFKEEQLTLRERQLTEHQQFEYDTTMKSVYPDETYDFKRKALEDSGAEPQDIWQIIDVSIGGDPRALKVKWDQIMKDAENAPKDKRAQALARFFQDLVDTITAGPQ